MTVSALPPLLRIRNLSKTFLGQPVLKHLSLEVQKGERISILGASGSGKSTLLRCINRLEIPDSGEIWVGGTLLGPSTEAQIRARVGMVFQQFHLFSHLNALENLCYAPVRLRRLSRAEAQEKAMGLLQRMGLYEKYKAFPRTLSGGEKQRIAIARALMLDPEMMLFDEPTSALDPHRVQEVLQVIQDLADTGMTLLNVTHEMGFVKEISTRVLFIEQGQILEDQKPEGFFKNPQHPRLLAFLNHPSAALTQKKID